MARLIVESGGQRREARIAGPVTIGRAKTATLCIDDKTLSREHTRVWKDGSRYVVQDLGSKNGTLLNGRLLKQPTALKNGDRIKVGPAVFAVVFDPGDAPAAAPAPAPPAPRAAAAPRPAPTRDRARQVQEQAMDALGPFMGCVYNIVLVGVVVVGAYVSKGIFKALLSSLAS